MIDRQTILEQNVNKILTSDCCERLLRIFEDKRSLTAVLFKVRLLLFVAQSNKESEIAGKVANALFSIENIRRRSAFADEVIP